MVLDKFRPYEAVEVADAEHLYAWAADLDVSEPELRGDRKD